VRSSYEARLTLLSGRHRVPRVVRDTGRVSTEPTPNHRRVRVTISGRVQGVFFRASCAERARILGLAGWVRNGEDGVVEAVFEGPPHAVEDMLAWCREGPALASVDRVSATDERPAAETGFRVTR
jgi:acylphosphatase